MIELGKELARLRNAHGLTQPEVAEALDLSREAISKYENGGVQAITPELLAAFAELYGADKAELAVIAGYSAPIINRAVTVWDFIPIPEDAAEMERARLLEILRQMALVVLREERRSVEAAVAAGMVAPDGTPVADPPARRRRKANRG